MFATPFDVRGSAFVLHASIGIALFSVSNESEIDLLKKADLAMYSAKDAGKNCYQFYSPQLSHRADHLMKWEQQLRVALTGAATVPRLSAEDRSDAALHHRLRGARALESSAARADSGERVHSGRGIDGADRADRRLRDSIRRACSSRSGSATAIRAVARREHLGRAVLARRFARNGRARDRGERHSAPTSSNSKSPRR